MALEECSKTTRANSQESILPWKPDSDATIGELIANLLAWYETENQRPRFNQETALRWRAHLKAFFGELKASELGADHLRSYRAKRTAEGAKDATINRELQILRKAYKLAAESEPPKVSHIPKFKDLIRREENVRKVFIDLPTAQKLRNAAAKEGLWVRAFLEMALIFGWRKGEIERLRIKNLRLSENVIRIEDTKNGEAREVSIADALKVLLQPLIAGRKPKEPLWPVHNFKYAWARICKRAGVRGFVFNDLRRTAVINMLGAGLDEKWIMNISGNRTRSMLDRYGIVRPKTYVLPLDLPSKPDDWKKLVPLLKLMPTKSNTEIQAIAGTKLSLPAMNRVRRYAGVPGPKGRPPAKRM